MLFAVVYTQAPLYYSNQNQYFLHGLAQAGLGHLAEDWLANTRDPTPIFSTLVAFTHHWLHESVFYLFYGLVLGVYFHCALGMFGINTEHRCSPLGQLLFVVLLLVVHSALARWASAQLTGVDYPWYFQAGLAGQYILGSIFQPSVMGVFLILSICLFLSDRPLTAVTVSSLAAVVHTTYLLSAAFITLSYLVLLFREGRRKEAFASALLALFMVAPIVVYNWVTFGPSSSDVFARAQHLLVHFRIPHHAMVPPWLDAVAVVQILWVVLAMWLVRGKRLCVILCTSFVLSFILALVQIGTGNDTLALLFPWRPSSYLVPLATGVLISRFVAVVDPRLQQWSPGARGIVHATLVLIVATLFAGGIAISHYRLGYRTSDVELPMLDYVREHKQPGDVYLIPFELPGPPTRRGSTSSDFRPVQGVKLRVIPLELQRFRLYTGAPIFVDFKAVPYKDVEVIEWHERVQAAQQFYKKLAQAAPKEAGEFLQRHGITHVVAPARWAARLPELTVVFEDEHYKVYRARASAFSGRG